jgi:hypothetical protein
MEGNATRSDAAAVYGRRERCFQDFQKKPFRFRDCARGVQLLSDLVDTHGLIHQSGLPSARLPNPSVDFDTFDFPETEHKGHELCDSPQRCFPAHSPFFSTTAILQDLHLPLELIELSSDPVGDMSEYLNTVHAAYFCNAFDQWLPLSPTREDKNEGLSFPPNSGRLRSMLLRELDRERISATQGALDLEREAQDSELEHFDEARITYPVTTVSVI